MTEIANNNTNKHISLREIAQGSRASHSRGALGALGVQSATAHQVSVIYLFWHFHFHLVLGGVGLELPPTLNVRDFPDSTSLAPFARDFSFNP